MTLHANPIPMPMPGEACKAQLSSLLTLKEQ